MEVGGELAGGEVAGGDVVVGWQDVPPRLEAGARDRRRAVGGPCHAAGLGLEGGTLVVQPQAADLVRGTRRADRDEQPLGGVERAVGVVDGERLVVGPPVAGVPQLGGEGLLDPGERILEDGSILGEDLEQDRGVAPVEGPGRPVRRPLPGLQHADPVAVGLGGGRGHVRVDEGLQPLGQHLEHPPDPVPVADSHRGSLRRVTGTLPSGSDTDGRFAPSADDALVPQGSGRRGRVRTTSASLMSMPSSAPDAWRSRRLMRRMPVPARVARAASATRE